MFRQLLEGVSSVLPSQCALCRRWPAAPVCEACARRFAASRLRCGTCALPVEPSRHPIAQTPHPTSCARCRRKPPVLSACIAAVDYAWPWSDCIVDFKFGQEPGWAGPLARLMRSATGAGPLLQGADLVVPMPLSVQRLRERGFNQSLELARRLGHRQVRADLLLRIRDTPAQSTLERSQRLSNVRGAFAVDPLGAALLHGRHVLVVDDVMTSGASLLEAVGVLRAAGAVQVSALVVARTDEAGDA